MISLIYVPLLVLILWRYNPALMSIKNPCLHCGACCAFFRISFYWGETDPDQGGTVPPELVDQLNDTYCCMKGTNQRARRCEALDGKIGEEVHCRIYEQRPTPCREFGIQEENGFLSITPEELERCNHARNAWGLPPLHLVYPADHWKHRPAQFHKRHLERIHSGRTVRRIPGVVRKKICSQ